MARTRCLPTFLIIVAALAMTACAFDLAYVKYDSVQMNTPAEMGDTFTLAEDVELTGLPCGYDRTIRKSTQWDCVGRIDAGEIYKSDDQSLTLECSNVFEAYLVMEKEQLVGFYLPVQEGYVKLKKPVVISTQ